MKNTGFNLNSFLENCKKENYDYAFTHDFDISSRKLNLVVTRFKDNHIQVIPLDFPHNLEICTESFPSIYFIYLQTIIKFCMDNSIDLDYIIMTDIQDNDVSILKGNQLLLTFQKLREKLGLVK